MQEADLQLLGHVVQQTVFILIFAPPLKLWYGMHW